MTWPSFDSSDTVEILRKEQRSGEWDKARSVWAPGIVPVAADFGVFIAGEILYRTPPFVGLCLETQDDDIPCVEETEALFSGVDGACERAIVRLRPKKRRFTEKNKA